MANTYKALATVTVGAGGAATIDFQNIPQTYTDLVLVSSLRNTSTSPDAFIRVNNQTSFYRSIYLYNNGGTVASVSDTTGTGYYTHQNRNSYTANTFSSNYAYIPNYVNSNITKVAISDMAPENNATSQIGPLAISSIYTGTESITRLTLIPGNGTFAQYSTATLYGVFNADVSSAPATPTIGTATAGNGSAYVTFTGVSNAASYTLTSSPDSITGTGTNSPITVFGLSNATSYTFTAKANNPFGSSANSAASNSITVAAVGYSNYSNDYTTFTKFNMSAESTSTLTIGVTNEASASASNSGVAGYRYGNTTNGVGCQKIAFSNDAVSTLSNSLPQFRYYATGQSNSGTAGYITGGATSGFAVRYRTIVKSPFSTDTPATLGTGFTNMGNANMVTSNNHVAGYTYGGESDTTGTINIINKINYSNDAISNSVATLSVAGRSGAAVSNDGTAGYTNLGTANVTSIDKLLYSSDTRSTISATIVANLNFSVPNYRFQVAGYWLGGDVSGSTSAIRKLLYSTESTSTLSATLAVADRNLGFGDMSNNGII